jgi:DnaJ-class molecular chaperone
MSTPYSHLHPELDLLTPMITDADLRSMYRPLLLRFHPDSQHADAEKFRALLDARNEFQQAARTRTLLRLKKEGWVPCTVCGGYGKLTRNSIGARLVKKTYSCRTCDSSGWRKNP